VIPVEYLGMAYGVSEIALAARKRSVRAGAESRDAGTLGRIWIVIMLSIGSAVFVATRVSWGRFEPDATIQALALGAFLAGLGLRWWAILVLGRFFTVDVAIHEGHELVVRGPYRVLRHPSYSGALLAFAGLGLVFGSWLALALLLVPITGAMIGRIHVEERALAQTFGAAWESYCARSWRLVPFVW
jgi:protein-S-isoprenylcysteine O-methyltransferase